MLNVAQSTARKNTLKVKTTFVPGAAAFSYEGWLSCIAFEEVFKNTLTCD